MPSLFVGGHFTLHSGAPSRWKIECDVLTWEDWHTLATIAVRELDIPPFGQVVGIPRGGTALAEQMESYSIAGVKHTLICDDVWTTGGSMRKMQRECTDGVYLVSGLVAFARNPVDDWVKPIWRMHP